MSRALKNSKTVDLNAELIKMIELITKIRTQADALDVTDAKELSSVTKSVSALAVAYKQATDSQIKLETHLAKVAADMSEEEQIEAVYSFITDLASHKRRAVVQRLMDYHRKNTKGGGDLM